MPSTMDGIYYGRYYEHVLWYSKYSLNCRTTAVVLLSPAGPLKFGPRRNAAERPSMCNPRQCPQPVRVGVQTELTSPSASEVLLF
jgi:hypothetical protein